MKPFSIISAFRRLSDPGQLKTIVGLLATTAIATAADRDRVEDGDYTKTVSIVFNGTTATVTNNAGVAITYGASTSAIAITSTVEGVEYILSGTSANGYVQITSTYSPKVTLNGVSLTSGTGPALSTFSTARSYVVMPAGVSNTLADGSTYTRTGSGTLHASGPLIFSGKGGLSLSGVKSHAIYGAGSIRCLGGDITVTAAAKDAVHSKTLFQMDHGKLNLSATGDGIDGDSGAVTINGGAISIRSTVDDSKGIGCDGALTVSGGSINMTLSGAKSKALSSKGNLSVGGGTLALNLSGAVAIEAITGTSYYDPAYCSALKCDGNLSVTGGLIAITHTGVAGKGFSADGNVSITGGTVDITTTGGPSATYTNASGVTDEAASDCISADGTVTLGGGSVILRTDGIAADGISADLAVNINAGTLDVTTKGNRSKGVKSNTLVSITGGTSTFAASGAVVLELVSTGRYDPSFCTAIKSDAAISISGGTTTITHSGQAGKGISADGNMSITGGTINVTSSGSATATYTNSSGATDVSGGDCITADGTLTITGGTITASSTGTAGDAISCDGAAVIGTVGVTATPVITASTSGAHVLISGSGMSANYSNAKAFGAGGNLTFNGGKYTGTTSTDGGEGLESKANLVINGGTIEITSYDDAINASTSVTVNGGNIYAYASNNDGIDSNGTFAFNGGTIISSGASAPEEGFDCDQNTFNINGGTLVGTGGATSTPSGTGAQNTAIYTGAGTANSYVAVKNSSNVYVLVYKIPRSYGSMKFLFSLPTLPNGSYTLYTGATVTGGTEFHGLYTGATVSGGTAKTFTVSGRVTSF